MRTRDEKKIEAIYKATLKLAGSYGLAGLTMNKISKEAKVAHGTLYVYFENKEVLLNSLYEHILKRGTMSIMSSISKLPVKDQLRSVWEVSLRYRVKNPFILIFVEQFVLSPFISSEGKKLERRYARFFEKLLDAGKKQGFIKPISNDILIALLSGFIRDVARQLVRTNKEVTPSVINDSFEICWDAIRRIDLPLGNR